MLLGARPTPLCDALHADAARALPRHHPRRSATNIDAGVSLHAACNANRVDANRTVVNTTDCEGPFRGVGMAWGGGSGVDRHRIGSLAAFQSPVAVQVTIHPSLRENGHMVMPVGTREWAVQLCTQHSV